jgi:hypothetical protein
MKGYGGDILVSGCALLRTTVPGGTRLSYHMKKLNNIQHQIQTPRFTGTGKQDLVIHIRTCCLKKQLCVDKRKCVHVIDRSYPGRWQPSVFQKPIQNIESGMTSRPHRRKGCMHEARVQFLKPETLTVDFCRGFESALYSHPLMEWEYNRKKIVILYYAF